MAERLGPGLFGGTCVTIAADDLCSTWLVDVTIEEDEAIVVDAVAEDETLLSLFVSCCMKEAIWAWAFSLM